MVKGSAAYQYQGEPPKEERLSNWKAAIGLQQVDGLKPSKYLLDLAQKNIDGELTLPEVRLAIEKYYTDNPPHTEQEVKEHEADNVSERITELISTSVFTLSAVEITSIHKHLFEPVYDFAGEFRRVNISKDEWVLNGKSVVYANYKMIDDLLEYDIDAEKKHEYMGLSQRVIAHEVADFISGIWETHPFAEGNTRTTAVFAIKYLHKLGFNTVNELFEQNACYFRNALVRANYSSMRDDIPVNKTYLYGFFDNLLFGDNNVLKNRELKLDSAKVATANTSS
jgi:fido (protein-threonine AMPylation protein)